MPYPTDPAARRVKRALIRRRILAEAELRIKRTGCSIVCGEDGQHASCIGAANCLCECHDEQGAK